jgi:hypothetical protein
MRRPPSAIAEKGLAAQAAAANTPWRRNIRLENAKMHLRSFKSIGEKSDFLGPVFRKHFWGNGPISCGVRHGASNRKQLNPNRNASGFPALNCHFGKNFGNCLGSGYLVWRSSAAPEPGATAPFVKLDSKYERFLTLRLLSAIVSRHLGSLFS